MKITALRPFFQINSNVIKNSCRLFSFKFDSTAASRFAAEQEEAKQPVDEQEEKPVANFRYQVCQPRTSPVEKAELTDMNQKQVRAAIEDLQLQPSMLPEYYQRQMDTSALFNPIAGTEQEKINQKQNSQTQRFLESKTYANVTLPLKAVKLANPFPEPVKMMMSRTVSDEEKAEQMLAESRSQRNYSDWASKSMKLGPLPTSIRRYYSQKSKSNKSVGTDSSKCKKLKETKNECPKMRLGNCPPPARKKCLRFVVETHCKKQEAPYPAYSEFCHEDPDLKPSECRLCPWKTGENPNFKPKKKKFHTFSHPLNLKRTGLEIDTVFHQEKPTFMDGNQVPEGMQCDLRKPPCERPKNRRCPPQEKKDKKKEKEKSKKPKKMADVFDTETMSLTQVQNILSLAKAPPAPNPKCKIRKFKFPPCGQTKKEEIHKQHDHECPKRPGRKYIQDCPNAGEKGGDKKAERAYTIEELLLDKKNSQHADKKKKNEPVDDDPCKNKRKGRTLNCPADVTYKEKKKRKPKKKTSGTSVHSVELPRP